MNVTERIIIINVGVIESYIFREWPLLTTVIIGETVGNINSRAFASCPKLEHVQFPDKLMSGIGGGAFAECISLNNITIRCNSISDNAFYKCIGLETITLYEGVRSIGSDAFRGCTNLVNIYIPSAVTSIGNPFLECTKLQFINVSEKNFKYSNYENDGVLYNKVITQIISYPNMKSKTFTIPKSVISIMNYTFAYCNNLERIFIDENVHYINSCAFTNCTSLQCIHFNGEISPEIQNDAFVNINATRVMTIETYQNETFGNMEITKGATLDECLQPTRTFTNSNTFTKLNTFTKSKSNFDSNTYVNTFSMNFTFVNTYTLTYSLSLIKTLSIYYYTFLKSYSVTFIESETKYIYVDFIYYNYTIIYFPEYFTYYSNFFYISYIEDVIINTNDNNTLIIIIIVIVIVIIIVFIMIIIIFMIKYQNKKRKQNEEEMNISDENNNKINEIDNTFSFGINNSNIEEDPFADDLKEEKFVSQI